MPGHPQTIITTTTLTDTLTTTSVFVPVTTETVTTTEIKIPTVTTTETEVCELQEIITTSLETWIEEISVQTTTETAQWVPVEIPTTTTTATETTITYSTAVNVEKTFTYTQLVWTETDTKTVTTASQAILTETVIPVDGTTTLTEIYTLTETLGTTQTAVYMTTLTGVRTATTVITVPADVPGHVGWFPAGTVIRLTGVDDYAELWVNGSCVATALSNGKPASAGFIAGSASYTIPQDGYYTISICNHDNRFGGPTNEGSLDLGGVPTVDTSQPGITTTTTEIVVNPGTLTLIPVDWTVTDYLTLTDTKIQTETFIPAGDATTTTATQTVTVITFEIDTKTQTQTVTETEGSVSYQTITVSTYAGMTLTDTITTTLTRTLTQNVIPTNMITTQLASEIKTRIEYVPVTYETVTTTKTLTTTETTFTVPLITQTQVNISVPATTITTVTRLVDLDCFGGVYYGFVPVDDVYRNANVIEHIRQGTDEHCIIR